MRAMRQVSNDSYYAGLDALRREAWDEFLRRVPPSRRRAALRALALDSTPALI